MDLTVKYLVTLWECVKKEKEGLYEQYAVQITQTPKNWPLGQLKHCRLQNLRVYPESRINLDTENKCSYVTMSTYTYIIG